MWKANFAKDSVTNAPRPSLARSLWEFSAQVTQPSYTASQDSASADRRPTADSGRASTDASATLSSRRIRRRSRQVENVIATCIVNEVLPSELTTRRVADEFKGLLDRGFTIRPAGTARHDPLGLLSGGYTPRHRFEVFDTTFYLTNIREDDNFRYFVAYVVPTGPGHSARRSRGVYPRIFYKDSSLVWRSPSHYIRSDDENWIGKGDLKVAIIDGVEMEYSAEETTNLPLEIQSPLDTISRRGGRASRDLRAIDLVLRRAPEGRFEPYRDFTAPRRRASRDARNLIHRGEDIAYFLSKNDPTSLRFVPGFEPDFDRGLVEVSHLRSRLYGGEIAKYRILSQNRRIQYQFVAGPKQVWIIPPQTLTTELTSYGVRTIDVNVDEDLCVPGYEYHFIDESEDPPTLHSQIPEGFAGTASEVDPSRADASPWIEKLPVIARFREKILRSV